MNTNDEITNGGNLFENLNFLNSKEFLEVSEQLSDIQFDKTAAVTTLMRTNSPFSACLKDVYQTQTGDIVSGWTNGSVILPFLMDRISRIKYPSAAASCPGLMKPAWQCRQKYYDEICLATR